LIRFQGLHASSDLLLRRTEFTDVFLEPIERLDDLGDLLLRSRVACALSGLRAQGRPQPHVGPPLTVDVAPNEGEHDAEDGRAEQKPN
jgi:hypothetical protein